MLAKKLTSVSSLCLEEHTGWAGELEVIDFLKYLKGCFVKEELGLAQLPPKMEVELSGSFGYTDSSSNVL